MYLLKLAACIIKDELVNPMAHVESKSPKLYSYKRLAHGTDHLIKDKSENEEEMKE
jgi:hypothetical protein